MSDRTDRTRQFRHVGELNRQWNAAQIRLNEAVGAHVAVLSESSGGTHEERAPQWVFDILQRRRDAAQADIEAIDTAAKEMLR